MLSFIVQRSFVTINSQCRAFMAVKKLKVSVNHHFVTKIHFIFCARPVHSHIHTNVFHSGPVFRHLTIANLWMVWNVWSTFMALFAGWAPGQALLCLLCGGGGGGLGGATREIWLENSHRRPHTTSEMGLLSSYWPKRQITHFCILYLCSDLHFLSLIKVHFLCFNFSLVSASGLHHNMTSDTSAICTLLPLLSPLTWEYWSHKGKFSCFCVGSIIYSTTLFFWTRYLCMWRYNSSSVTVLPAYFVKCVEKNYHKFTVT